eukprot:TRINITY_DN81125_c0_g1_i1.p1 TRINITY_DN81125_c0_g1~~TRINITY_DN81125_c0_g1_i1.p1  ORF type:complete len:236 (-),score=32.09 TRINITY_DN81125_c0_g1_i1:146-853(-)
MPPPSEPPQERGAWSPRKSPRVNRVERRLRDFETPRRSARRSSRAAPMRPPDEDVSVELPEPTTVWLNVYDLTTSGFVGALNRLASPLGMGGVFHVGMQLMGKEYSYGYNTRGSGVAVSKPREDSVHSYNRSIALGTITMSQEEIDVIIRELAMEWLGQQYSFVNRNCCHFCQELALRLGVDPVPEWISSLAQTAKNFSRAIDQLATVLDVGSRCQSSAVCCEKKVVSTAMPTPL